MNFQSFSFFGEQTDAAFTFHLAQICTKLNTIYSGLTQFNTLLSKEVLCIAFHSQQPMGFRF